MTESQEPVESDFPEPIIKSADGTGATAQMIVSKLWILTVLCAVAAIGLVVWQSGGLGPEIDVRFAEGHGLQAGDPVRYRGITVGEVREIVLDQSLESVVVRIQLTEAAADIAREGARFWIERPNISIGKVRGLDTLVGGRFVGVLPGPSDAPACSEFYGLEVASAPVGNLAEGLEITLEGQNRYGLQVGSPVNYRGVTVGQVLSVGLTNDAATVEARVYIESQYRELVRETTQFWSSSGLDVKIGFSGIELDADTLATIAAGGVGFATPNPPGRPAVTGQRFTLFKSPKEEWLRWQPRVAIANSGLPPGAKTPRPLFGIRTQSGALGVLGAGRERGWLLLLSSGHLLGPANVLTGSGEEVYELEVAGKTVSLPLAALRESSFLASGKLSNDLGKDVTTWPLGMIRTAKAPENLVITCGNAEKTLPVSAQRLKVSAEGWIVEAGVPLDDTWHGASVIAASDAMLVGILTRRDDQSLIVAISDELLLE